MAVYGSCLWDFESKVLDDFYVNWRKSVRRVWGLPPRTHCALLNLICDDLPVETQLHIRFLKFIHGVLSSDNECVKMCGQTALNGSASDASNSINFICCMYGLSKYEAFKESTGYLVNHVTSRVAATDDNMFCAHAIKELVECRERPVGFQFTAAEISELINFLCTA